LTLSTEPIRSPHILVVHGDDAELDRERAMLEAAGYDVTTVDLPDIGLIRRVEPDAVVLGLMFRGQASGLAFLERHAADPVTSPIPVVVHADQDELSAEQRSRLAAVAGTVVPAGHESELLDELGRVLGNAAATGVPTSR
jgi:CheY-like chemotaxis protein